MDFNSHYLIVNFVRLTPAWKLNLDAMLIENLGQLWLTAWR